MIDPFRAIAPVTVGARHPARGVGGSSPSRDKLGRGGDGTIGVGGAQRRARPWAVRDPRFPLRQPSGEGGGLRDRVFREEVLVESPVVVVVVAPCGRAGVSRKVPVRGAFPGNFAVTDGAKVRGKGDTHRSRDLGAVFGVADDASARVYFRQVVGVPGIAEDLHRVGILCALQFGGVTVEACRLRNSTEGCVAGRAGDLDLMMAVARRTGQEGDFRRTPETEAQIPRHGRGEQQPDEGRAANAHGQK